LWGPLNYAKGLLPTGVQWNGTAEPWTSSVGDHGWAVRLKPEHT